MLNRLAVRRKIISENQALDQGRFISEWHLQTHTTRRFNDGLDCRLDDSAARQLHQQVVADLVFGVVRQIVVPSSKRISSYLAEALRFAIAG